MGYDANLHHRRSIRLRGYDYTQAGAYFVTLCTRDRACILGEVDNGRVNLTAFGHIVAASWQDLPSHYPFVTLDAFVVMPNHVHGIIMINANVPVGAGLKPAPTIARNHALPEIVRALKTFSARRINALRQTPGTPVWQRNYYEHVVRTEGDLNRIREYILANPLQWAHDEENPARIP